MSHTRSIKDHMKRYTIRRLDRLYNNYNQLNLQFDDDFIHEFNSCNYPGKYNYKEKYSSIEIKEFDVLNETLDHYTLAISKEELVRHQNNYYREYSNNINCSRFSNVNLNESYEEYRDNLIINGYDLFRK